MKTIIITNDTAIAQDAQSAGVSRIMVDLESHGKKERQASRTTFISTHKKEDIAPIRKVLKASQLMVRINPWHRGSQEEIDHAVAAGADIIMLPMITSMMQLDNFLEHLAGRAEPLPLVETAYSMAHIGEIAENKQVKEIYIGLNDLHLSLGLDFLFEPLGLGLIDWMAGKITAEEKSFGFGGIAAMHKGELPAERVLAEHVRLGSSAVILSSRFCKDVEIENPEGRKQRIADSLSAMQAAYHTLSKRNPMQQYEDAKRTAAIIQQLAERARSRSSF